MAAGNHCPPIGLHFLPVYLPSTLEETVEGVHPGWTKGSGAGGLCGGSLVAMDRGISGWRPVVRGAGQGAMLRARLAGSRTIHQGLT